MYDEVLARFDQVEITVFGDLIADCWLIGEANHLCREAPVATIDVHERKINPGGAANAAANLAALGAHVTLVGTVGDDAVGDDLCRSLDVYGVNTKAVRRESITHTKNRLVVAGKVISRFDQRRLSPDVVPNFAEDLPLLIADYDMSSWQEEAIAQLAHNRPRFLAVDSHHPAIWTQTRPDLVTPNWYEATGLMPAWDGQCHRSQHLRRHREEILAHAGATRALITLDRDGATLLTPSHGWYVETPAAPERNTIGAGDTATAALLLALLTNVPDERALLISNAAARIAVAQSGTTVVSRDDLRIIDLRSTYGDSDSNDQPPSTTRRDAGFIGSTRSSV